MLHLHLLHRFDLKNNEPISLCPASSSEWESDVSVVTMFESLSLNMTSSSQLEPVKATDVEPWAQQLNF